MTPEALYQDPNSQPAIRRLELPSEDLWADSRYWRHKGWYLAAQEKWTEAIEAYQRALDHVRANVATDPARQAGPTDI